MKKRNFWNWALGITLAVSPLACAAQPAAPPDAANAPVPEVAGQDLENASGTAVSTPPPAAPSIALTGPLEDVVKLSQAGVDENVILAYVKNYSSPFNPNADEIIYMKDVGVSDAVMSAMMQHDQVLQPNTPPPTVVESPPPAPAPEPPPPPPVAEGVQVNTAYTYFYNSLSPYGTWVNIEGCGLCWRPSAVVVESGWQPYCNGGRWVYSDCGWYWQSDYEWGWAAFHYGRWFHNRQWGWCWVPDTVWGPSWVSWRESGDYCGWAPLPPAACFHPGVGFTYYGRSVGVGFSFGISAGWFTFVSVGHVCDREPFRARVPREHVTQIFNNTTIINNQITVVNNTKIINRGISIDRVRAVSHQNIQVVRIRDTDNPKIGHGEQLSGRTLTVYHPRLPEPPRTAKLVGQGVPPAKPAERLPRIGATTTVINRGSGSAATTRERNTSPSGNRNQPQHNMSTHSPENPPRQPLETRAPQERPSQSVTPVQPQRPTQTEEQKSKTENESNPNHAPQNERQITPPATQQRPSEPRNNEYQRPPSAPVREQQPSMSPSPNRPEAPRQERVAPGASPAQHEPQPSQGQGHEGQGREGHQNEGKNNDNKQNKDDNRNR